MSIEKKEELFYDRQIRLWGQQTQFSLKNARILVVLQEDSLILGQEFLKNIALIGFGTIVISGQSKLIGNKEVEESFFFSESDIGKNVLEVLAEKLQEMNMNINIKTKYMLSEEGIYKAKIYIGKNCFCSNEKVQQLFLFSSNTKGWLLTKKGHDYEKPSCLRDHVNTIFLNEKTPSVFQAAVVSVIGGIAAQWLVQVETGGKKNANSLFTYNAETGENTLEYI